LDATLLTILGFGFLMSSLAVIGGLFVFLPEPTLKRWLKPLVAFAAGSLLGGAFFHMLPHALGTAGPNSPVMLWVAVGFTSFFALDQLLEWHHCHRPPSEHVRPLGPLLLVADGVHNLLGGLAIGAIFMTDVRAGVAAWIAAALHEIPQEIGDFGAIVHAGYSRGRALFYNFLSALTFPLGGVLAYIVGQSMNVHFLVALGAGNFIYIAGADLIPEVKRAERLRETAVRFVFFVLGIALLFAAREIGVARAAE
jgi:zinc and cadmium transporter